MKPEKLFHELLGLGSHWRVTELEYLKGKREEVRIVIEDEYALLLSTHTSDPYRIRNGAFCTEAWVSCFSRAKCAGFRFYL